MQLPDSCKEIFLEGFTDVYFYPIKGSTLPMPFSIANITSMNNCTFANCPLHLVTGKDDFVVCSSITAKISSDIGGNGTVYAIELAASVESGYENVREVLKSISTEDYYIVLRNGDGTLQMFYTLPNTFMAKPSNQLTQSDDAPAITVTAKAMSDMIPITIKGQ